MVVVANTLDECCLSARSGGGNENVGFIGTYSSLPNLEAACFWRNRYFLWCFRKIRRHVLNLPARICRRADEKKLRSLGYVDILGAVADSDELYRQCRIIALPVFVRGGVPLKLVEALAREKAVVACPELVAGLAVRDGYDLLIRENPQDFADAISSLLADDSLCQRLGQNGRETFMRNWSRSHSETILRQSSVLASCAPEK